MNWAEALAVLVAMGERHALLQWRLRLRLLPDKTTTFQLRNPPEGATLADRVQALFVLVDVHRWSGESVPIARNLINTWPVAELSGETDGRVRFALRLAVAGFVGDAQAALQELAARCPAVEVGHALAVEWSRVSDVPSEVLRNLAAALMVDDATVVDGAAAPST